MFSLGVVDVLFMIVSVILIVLVALQSSKQGLSDSLTGGNSELFKNQKERGAINYIILVQTKHRSNTRELCILGF